LVVGVGVALPARSFDVREERLRDDGVLFKEGAGGDLDRYVAS